MNNDLSPRNRIQQQRWLLIGAFIAFSIGNLFFLVSRINSSESRLFPEGTNIHHGWPWRNGDHMYYVSSAIDMAGYGYTNALIITTHIFRDWPGWYQDLDFGFQSIDSAPLIYARAVLPLAMALGFKIFGVYGLAIPVLLAGIVSTIGLIRWLYIQGGPLLAASGLVTASGSLLFIKYGAGIFTEAFLILITVSWLFLLPFNRHRTKHGYPMLGLVVSIIILGFVRQAPLLPLSVLFTGWLVALVSTRKFFNPWFSYSLAGGTATLLTYGAIFQWAPLAGYSPATASQAANTIAVKAGAEGYNSMWDWAGYGAQYTFDNIAASDKFMFVLLPLFFIGAWLLRRTSMPYIALAVFVTSIPYMIAAFPEYRFLSTGVVFFLVVCSFGLFALIPRKLKERSPAVFQNNYFADPSLKFNKRLSISICVFLIVQLAATVFVYQPNKSDLILSEPVGIALPALLGQEGRLECYGNNAQVWLITPDGSRYAVSGTALSHSFNSIKATSASKKIARYMTYEATSPFIKRCLAASDSSRS